MRVHDAGSDLIHKAQRLGTDTADGKRALHADAGKIKGHAVDHPVAEVVEREEEIPKDALHIAKILGLHSDLIDRARELMK